MTPALFNETAAYAACRQLLSRIERSLTDKRPDKSTSDRAEAWNEIAVLASAQVAALTTTTAPRKRRALRIPADTANGTVEPTTSTPA